MIINQYGRVNIEFLPRNRSGKITVRVETEDDIDTFELSIEEEMELLKFLIKS